MRLPCTRLVLTALGDCYHVRLRQADLQQLAVAKVYPDRSQ